MTGDKLQQIANDIILKSRGGEANGTLGNNKIQLLDLENKGLSAAEYMLLIENKYITKEKFPLLKTVKLKGNFNELAPNSTNNNEITFDLERRKAKAVQIFTKTQNALGANIEVFVNDTVSELIGLAIASLVEPVAYNKEQILNAVEYFAHSSNTIHPETSTADYSLLTDILQVVNPIVGIPANNLEKYLDEYLKKHPAVLPKASSYEQKLMQRNISIFTKRIIEDFQHTADTEIHSKIYRPAVKHLLGKVFNNELPNEERLRVLEEIKLALGDCNSPIRDYLVQVAIELYNQKNELSKIMPLIEREAVKNYIIANEELMSLINEASVKKDDQGRPKKDETIEVVNLMTDLIFSQEINNRQDNPIQIEGLEHNLTSKSTNIGFGINLMMKNEKLKEKFIECFCLLDEKNKPQKNNDGKYVLDKVKVNVIVESHMAKMGIVSEKQKLLNQFDKEAKKIIQQYDLLDKYDDKDALKLLSFPDQKKELSERLTGLSDHEIKEEYDKFIKEYEVKAKGVANPNKNVNNYQNLAITAPQGQPMPSKNELQSSSLIQNSPSTPTINVTTQLRKRKTSTLNLGTSLAGPSNTKRRKR